jgi:DNA topoisomerase-6 subunit A
MVKKDSKSIATARKKEILESLKQLGQRTYDDVDNGRFPEFAFPSRSVSNIVYDPKLKQYVLDKVNVKRSAGNIKHIRPFTQLLWLAYFADKLVSEGKTSTLRDAYYSSQADAMEFVDQAESDEIITDLETVLSRAREEFKIYPEERSAIFGDLTIEYTVPRYEGRRLNLNSHPDGYLIGPSLSTAEFVETSAEMVIAVEKGGIFTRFVEEQVEKKYKAILVDTSGQAPRSTRYMLQRLNKELNLPVYVMTDGDVYGEHIAMVVISGSVKGDEPIVVRDAQGVVRPVPIGEFVDECIGKFGYFSDDIGNDVCSGIPFEVLTVDAKNQGVFKSMISVIRHRHNGELITVHTASGKRVTVTPSHSIFVFEKGRVVSKPTSDLKKGDLVVITRKLSESTRPTSFVDVVQELTNPPEGHKLPKMFVVRPELISRYHRRRTLESIVDRGKAPQFGTYQKCYVEAHARGTHREDRCPAKIWLTKKFARLLGYYTAGGWIASRNATPHSVNFCFDTHDSEVIEDALDCINSVFPGINVTQVIDQKGHAVTLSFGGAVIASLFLKICGSGFATKKVPTILFSADQEYGREYLLGCFGDGNIGNSGGLCWKHKNSKLISELGYLFTKLGVQYSISANGEEIVVNGRSEVEKLVSVILHSDDQLVTAGNISKRGSSSNLLPNAFPVVASGLAKLRNEILRHQHHDIRCKYTSQLLCQIEKERLPEAGINRMSATHVLEHILECNLTHSSREISEQASQLLDLARSDIAFDPIVSMDLNRNEGYVYDVSVPEIERFVGGRSGILLHNSANAAHLRDLTVPTAKWVGVWASVMGDEPVVITRNGLLRNEAISRFYDKAKEAAEGEGSSITVPKLEALCCTAHGVTSTRPVGAITRHSYDGDIFEIRTLGGFTVKTTANHSVQRFNEESCCLESVQVSELKDGDLLASCFRVPSNESLIRLNLARLISDEYPQFAGNVFVEGEEAKEFSEYLRTRYSKKILSENFEQVLKHKERGVKLSYFLAEGRVPVKGFLRLQYSKGRVPIVVNDLNRFARLMGYFVAEGGLSKGKSGSVCELSFSLAEDDYAQDARECIRNTVELDSRVDIRVGSNAQRIRFGNSLLAQIFTKVLGVGERVDSRQVPFIFFNTPIQAKKAFLLAYFRGNNMVNHREGTPLASCTVSRKLASDLVILLRQLGVVPCVSKSDGKYVVSCAETSEIQDIVAEICKKDVTVKSRILNLPGRLVFDTSDSRRQQLTYGDKSDVHGLLFGGGGTVNIGNSRVRQENSLFELTMMDSILALDSFVRNRVALLPVKEIRNLGKISEPVYDIEVEDVHTFVGGLGGIVLHNSDIVKYKLPTDPMTEADLKRAQELKKDPRYHGGVWQRELDIFLKIKRKSELEAFSKYGLTFIVTNYLKEKMEEAKSM